MERENSYGEASAGQCGSAFNVIPSHQLIVRELSCQIGRAVLFKNISFSVLSGQCLEITGDNGAGKSTLLRAISGLSEPNEGDSRLVLNKDSESTDLRRVLYQGHAQGFKDQLSAYENLLWQAQLDSSAYTVAYPLEAAVEDALLTVDLNNRKHIAFGRLSAGQKRRCMLARLAICKQTLSGIKLCWALDEPLTALDEQGQILLKELLIQHLNEGGSAVCCTHQSLNLAGFKPLKSNHSSVLAALELNLSAAGQLLPSRASTQR